MNGRRLIAMVVISLLMSSSAQAALFDLGGKEKKAREAELARLRQDAQKEQGALKEMEQKYKELEIDRNNVLAQTKQLLADKSKMTELESKQESLEKGMQTVMSQKDRLLTENQKLKKELASIVENHDRLKDNFQELQIREDAEHKEIGTLREALARRVEASPQYLLVQNESRAVRQENETFRQTIASLDAKLKKALEYIRKVQDRDLKFMKQLETMKRVSRELKRQNEALTGTNRSLNQHIEKTPARVTDLARQNETLVRETAQMHYNMGVLFTESQKFGLAAKEFERALELDPGDGRSHYNLGYLYAEQFGKPDQAMVHFKRFLETNADSKEAEAVKSYLVMHHTYQEKSLDRESGNPF